MFGFNKREIMKNKGVKKRKEDKAYQMKEEYIASILALKKSPIVLLDPLWHKVKEHLMSGVLDQEEKHLQDLLKERARLNVDFKEYTAVKQQFMKEVLEQSQQVQEQQNAQTLHQLDNLHQSILEINKKLEAAEGRLEDIEEEIQEQNNKILIKMVTLGYHDIEVYKAEALKLEEEIEALREEMLRKTQEKKLKEDWVRDIYQYLHSIVGREPIEVIDKHLEAYRKKEK